MLLTEAGCVFVGFILYISGVNGEAKKSCALKGSSVKLSCSAEHPISSKIWYTVHWNSSRVVELSADGHRVTYNMSEEGQLTLTIKDLRENDANYYCCRDNRQLCLKDAILLDVADLQVKVIPATEGQTVTLMCSTSCPLTETPAAYIWYKNREFLYEDWSPWYQELVSSEEAVRYSCAIKGYEDLRAPEVSVDSITSTCFTVTYAKGRMCSYQQKSENEPCSITYPREILIQRTPVATSGYVRLTYSTSCPLTDPQTTYMWYRNRYAYFESDYLLFRNSSNNSFSCAVNGLEHLHSADVCTENKNCWSVNYKNRIICTVEGSSVNISSDYSHPYNQQPKSKFWYKIQRRGEEEAEKLIKAAGHVKYHDNMKNHHILNIIKVKETDSGEYTFRVQKDNERSKWPDLPGVTLVVTGVNVKLHPAVVTEGQRVTLTCSTSCPLSGTTQYIWHVNGEPLTLPQNQNKHLVLDPVSSEHAGNYSCAVTIGKRNISSTEKTLTIHSTTELQLQTIAAAAGVGAALLVVIPLTVCWWIRKKTPSRQSARPETSGMNMNQLNSSPLYENISAQPTKQNDNDYCTLLFSKNHTEDLYSTVEQVYSK